MTGLKLEKVSIIFGGATVEADVPREAVWSRLPRRSDLLLLSTAAQFSCNHATTKRSGDPIKSNVASQPISDLPTYLPTNSDDAALSK